MNSPLPRLLLSSFALFAATFVTAADTIPLWPAPFSTGTEVEVLSPKGNYTRVSQIHNPSLTVYPAPSDIANGTGVIIAPGGGHQFLSIDLEGTEVAAWLNQQGVTAFVLKYRLYKEPGSPYSFSNAVADAHRAIQLVRSRAADWKLAADRIGILGFSAGGQVAGHAAIEFTSGDRSASDPLARLSSRPDFQVLVYGNTDATALIQANTPPAFMICAQDDGNKPGQALALATRFLELNIPAELHIYQSGGHAYAMRDYGQPIHTWNQRLRDWMRTNGWLPRP